MTTKAAKNGQHQKDFPRGFDLIVCRRLYSIFVEDTLQTPSLFYKALNWKISTLATVFIALLNRPVDFWLITSTRGVTQNIAENLHHTMIGTNGTDLTFLQRSHMCLRFISWIMYGASRSNYLILTTFPWQTWMWRCRKTVRALLSLNFILIASHIISQTFDVSQCRASSPKLIGTLHLQFPHPWYDMCIFLFFKLAINAYCVLHFC